MTAIVYDGKTFVADTGVTVDEYYVGEVDKVKTYYCTTWDVRYAKYDNPVVVIVAAAGDRSNYIKLVEAIYDFTLGDASYHEHLAELSNEHNAIVLTIPLDEQSRPTSKRMFLVNNREIFESEDRPMAVGYMATYFRMGTLLGHTAEELMIPVVGRYRCVGPRYRVFDVDELVAEAEAKGIKHYKRYTDTDTPTKTPDKPSDSTDFGNEVRIEMQQNTKTCKPPIAPPPLRVVKEGRRPIAPPGCVVKESAPLSHNRLWTWITSLFR